MAEYLLFSLRDALARSSIVLSICSRSGTRTAPAQLTSVSCAAVRALGFEVDDEEAESFSIQLDDDRSGKLEYAELNTMLRKNAFGEGVRARLKRAKDVRDDSRSAKMTMKNMNVNYTSAKLSALDPMVKLEANSEMSVQQQLANALAENSAKLIDLFREWDEDGNGSIDKTEFRKSVAALGTTHRRRTLMLSLTSLMCLVTGMWSISSLRKLSIR